MRRFSLLLAVTALSGLGAMVTKAAAQSPELSFDVASIKEIHSVTDSASAIAPPTPGRVRIVNTPLRFILHYAFNVRDHQLIGAPEWADSVRFDITATYPVDPVHTESDTRAMLRTLLADRFGLKTHRERRDAPIYALVMTRKDGRPTSALVRSTIDCEKWVADGRPRLAAGSPSPVAPAGRRPVCQMLTTRRFITAGAQTMQQLADVLQALTGRPVADRTGLTDAFDFDLQWTSGPVAPAAPGAAVPPDDGPSIFVALQEQLGLRLVPDHAPFEVIVVDQIDRPTPD